VSGGSDEDEAENAKCLCNSGVGQWMVDQCEGGFFELAVFMKVPVEISTGGDLLIDAARGTFSLKFSL